MMLRLLIIVCVLTVFMLWLIPEIVLRVRGRRPAAAGDIEVISSGRTGKGGAESDSAFRVTEAPDGTVVADAAGQGTGDAAPSQEAAGMQDNAPDAAAGGAQAAAVSDYGVVHLREDDRYTGDLILVNSSHAYNFEANADEISLVNIKSTQSYSYPVHKEEMMAAKHIMKALDSMIHDCDESMGERMTGIESAYRSSEYQQQVYDEMKDEYGSEYAEKYVAHPGNSEHHTGLALDLGIFYDDGSEGSFSGSDNADWMAKNSWKYGFIRRYAENKIDITGISNEAWHFRYTGVPHAFYMHHNDLCLEEYINYLRNSTSADAPLEIDYGTGSASVYYTLDNTLQRPGTRYDVSGDNCGGYIITVYH